MDGYNPPEAALSIDIARHRDMTWSYGICQGDDTYVSGASGFPNAMDMAQHMMARLVQHVYQTPLITGQASRQAQTDAVARHILERAFGPNGVQE